VISKRPDVAAEFEEAVVAKLAFEKNHAPHEGRANKANSRNGKTFFSPQEEKEP